MVNWEVGDASPFSHAIEKNKHKDKRENLPWGILAQKKNPKFLLKRTLLVNRRLLLNRRNLLVLNHMKERIYDMASIAFLSYILDHDTFCTFFHSLL